MVLREEINSKMQRFRELCSSHQVRYIYAFGSSVTDRFDEEKSDIDLLVEVDAEDPVEVGELVSLLASVNYVGNTSLMVGIKVISENVKSGFVKHTNTSYFTMVAKGDDDKPTQVPGLILESREDARRFLEAIRRRELSRRYQTELANAKTILQVEEGLHLLQHERCQIAF